MDGEKQRRALSAAEQAIRALGSGNAERARRAAATAIELDQIAVFGPFASAVGGAADELEVGGAIDGAHWDAIAEAVGPGPLQELVRNVAGA